MASTDIRLEITDGVAWLILDGAATRNSLDEESVQAMLAACAQIDDDETVGAVVITGVETAFCSGAHTSVLAALRGRPEEQVRAGLGRVYEAFARVRELRVPTLALVNGAAVGAGVNLAMVCDLRICAEDALFVSGFARLGIHPGGGHFNLIAKATNQSVASAMGLFAQRVDGRRAEELGLVWAAVPYSELRDTALKAVEHLAKDPALARELVKSLRETASDDVPWLQALEIERNRQVWTFTRAEE